MTGDDELEALALEVRRAYGDRFPLPRRDETASDRELREEMTRDVLENQVLAEVERRRLADRLSPLTDAEQHTLVELVLSEMFGLPKLLSVLRDPLVTDVLVFGADPVRVERADGTRQLLSPLVRRDRDLERIIYDTAAARRRPFNREHPFVDLELEPGVRFHGEGFDVVSRPLVTIRRAAVFGARLDDLAARGMLDDAAVALLRAAVAADLSVLVAGRMGSGKTTLLRALIGEIEPTDVLVTIETDFELNIGQMGTHPFVHAYQARIPSTSDGTGISCADMMVPALPPHSSTAMSKLRLRSSSDIEKNSPCLPAMNRPSMPRSSIQWRMLARNPASFSDRSGLKGLSAAAQIPRMCSRA